MDKEGTQINIKTNYENCSKPENELNLVDISLARVRLSEV